MARNNALTELQQHEAQVLHEFIYQKLMAYRDLNPRMSMFEARQRVIEALEAYMGTRINFELLPDGSVTITKPGP